MQDITSQNVVDLVLKHNACVNALWEIWKFGDGVYPEHLKVKQEPFAKLFDELYAVRYNPQTDYADAQTAFLYTARKVFREYEKFANDTRKEINRLKKTYVKEYIIALINLTKQVEFWSKHEHLTQFQINGLKALSEFCVRCWKNIDTQQKYDCMNLSDAEIDKFVSEIKENTEARFDIRVLAERIKWFNSMKTNLQAKAINNKAIAITKQKIR